MTHTPCASAQTTKESVPGIILYTTADHGGFWLSPERVAEMPKPLREFVPWAGPNFYEEDCDWAFVALSFPLHFWEVFAARKCKELKPRVSDKYDAQYRKHLIEAALQECQQFLDQSDRPDARAKAADVVALYGDDSDLKELVDKARAMVKDLGSKPSGPG